MRALDKVYAVILLSPKKESYKIYNLLNSKYNKTKFEKDLYNTIGSLIEQNKEIDLMTVALGFKEQKIYDKTYIGKLSAITGNIPAETFLTVNQILAGLKYSNDIDNAKQTADKIYHLINSGNYTNNNFLDILSNTSTIKNNVNNNVIKNSDLIFQLLEKHEKSKNGINTGLSLGFSTLRRYIQLEPVDMMVVGARPAMGKTAFAVEIVCRLARQNKKVALFSLEMSAEQMMRRIVGNLAKLDTNKIKFGECNSTEIEKIYTVQSAKFLDNITIFEGSNNVRQISQKVNDLKLDKGCDLFIVDYLQKVMPSRSNSSRYEQVTSISNGIKFISQNLKIPSLCLAQLNRENARTGKLPSLPDLRESGEIEQDASIVSFLHRPEYYGEETTSNGTPAENICEFLIAKNREGSIDKFEFAVNLKNSSFDDISEYDIARQKLTADETPF
jgi:replicative DNA helicase|tara:strand:- start:317 stop:1648 length:1332 start_codon:yes stop_codon:yes gene_type:complete